MFTFPTWPSRCRDHVKSRMTQKTGSIPAFQLRHSLVSVGELIIVRNSLSVARVVELVLGFSTRYSNNDLRETLLRVSKRIIDIAAKASGERFHSS